MIIIYKLTDPNFLFRAAMIELAIIVVLIVMMLVVSVYKKWRASVLRKHQIHLNLLLDQAILNDALIDLTKVPDELKKMDTLLPILENYDHNFKDEIWVRNKQHLIMAFLEKHLPVFLNSRSWQKKQEALRLITLWPEKLFNPSKVLPCLSDKIYLVRIAAAYALIKTGRREYIEAVVIKMIQDPVLAQYPYRDYLIQGGEPVFTSLIQIAETSKDEKVVATCLDVLSSRIHLKLTPLGLQYVKSNDPDCRLSAVKILESIGTPEAIQTLIQCLEDKDIRIRRRSAEALGHLHAISGIPALLRLLEDQDWLTRIKAAQALKDMGTQGMTALFTKDPHLSTEAYATSQHVLAMPRHP